MPLLVRGEQAVVELVAVIERGMALVVREAVAVEPDACEAAHYAAARVW